MTCLIAPWTTEYWCASMTERYIEMYGRGKIGFMVDGDFIRLDDGFLYW